MLDGQFDWGSRLLKSNGGVQRFSHVGNQQLNVKAEESLTATLTSGADTKVGLSDLAVENPIAVTYRIKVTLGITG